jgi:mitogen-activated protein kinase kinase 1
MSRLGLSLTIEPVQREVAGFGTISKDNISIGPDGLTVDGARVNPAITSLKELEDTDELLGTGVSGSVRKVRHKSTGHIYALKNMQLENSEEFLEKKLVELKTLLASNHPNIVGFYGAFYNDGTLSFVLEFMDKGTLADLTQQVKIIPENILGKLTFEMLKGLNYLHKKLHLIHRDIKPQNILINSKGQIKITDFGVSGEIANTVALAKTFVGTVKYMSPSRIKGLKHSAKSDIWSFGLVVLEAAIGTYPYQNDDSKTTFFTRLNDIVNKPAPRPPPDKFSTEFVQFIEACLQKDEAKTPDAAVLLESSWLAKSKDLDVSDYLMSH